MKSQERTDQWRLSERVIMIALSVKNRLQILEQIAEKADGTVADGYEKVSIHR